MRTTLLVIGLVLVFAATGLADTVDWMGQTWTKGPYAGTVEVMPNGDLHTVHAWAQAVTVAYTYLNSGVSQLQLSFDDLGDHTPSVVLQTTGRDLATSTDYTIYLGSRPYENMFSYETSVNSGTGVWTQVAARPIGNNSFTLLQEADSTLKFYVNGTLAHTDTYFRDNNISFYLWQALLIGYGQEGGADNTFTSFSATAVPEPGSMLALGLGLTGLVGSIIRRRR